MAGQLSVSGNIEFNASSRSPRLLFCALAPDASFTASRLRDADIHTARVHDAEELAIAISAASPDLIVLSPEMLRNILNARPPATVRFDDLEYALTGLRSRSADIVRMLAKGLRNQEIANSLGLSLRTVKSILSSLYVRYEVTNRTELLGMLMEQGYLAATQSPSTRISKPNRITRSGPVIVSSKREYA
jgi:DNA-binding NarL/FixJ family response regulator